MNFLEAMKHVLEDGGTVTCVDEDGDISYIKVVSLFGEGKKGVRRYHSVYAMNDFGNYGYSADFTDDEFFNTEFSIYNPDSK